MKIEQILRLQKLEAELALGKLNIFSTGTPYWVSIGSISKLLKESSESEFFKIENIECEDPDDRSDYVSDEFMEKHLKYRKFVQDFVNKNQINYGEFCYLMSKQLTTESNYLMTFYN